MALIECFADPDEAERGILEALARKEKIMGFGHRVYTRSRPAVRHHQALGAPPGRRRRRQRASTRSAERIEEVMWREKRLFPNLDFYSASAYHFLGIPTAAVHADLRLSRASAGWSAHIIEQRADNKLIRPTADYIGPEPRPLRPHRTPARLKTAGFRRRRD